MYNYIGYTTTTTTSTQYFLDNGFIDMLWYCFLTTWIILGIVIMLLALIWLTNYLYK